MIEHPTKLGRWLGLSLFLMVLSGILSLMYRGISSSLLQNPDMLNQIMENSRSMRLSIFFSSMTGFFNIIFLGLIYQILSQRSKLLAISCGSLFFIAIMIALVGDVCHYVLLESVQFIQSTSSPKETLLSIASFSIYGYNGAHFLSLIFFSGSMIMLHIQFIRMGLLPRWLSIWGILAAGTVMCVTWLRIFDQFISFYFYLQNGVFMITFTFYILVKGLKSPRVEKDTA